MIVPWCVVKAADIWAGRGQACKHAQTRSGSAPFRPRVHCMTEQQRSRQAAGKKHGNPQYGEFFFGPHVILVIAADREKRGDISFTHREQAKMGNSKDLQPPRSKDLCKNSRRNGGGHTGCDQARRREGCMRTRWSGLQRVRKKCLRGLFGVQARSPFARQLMRETCA